MEGLTKGILGLYDLAEKVAEREGKTHRETFGLLLDYMALTISVEGKEKEIEALEKELKDLISDVVILAAIKQRKTGKG